MKKATYTPPKLERVQLMPEGLIASSGDNATMQLSPAPIGSEADIYSAGKEFDDNSTWE